MPGPIHLFSKKSGRSSGKFLYFLMAAVIKNKISALAPQFHSFPNENSRVESG